MESLSLGITARKDAIEQIRRFFGEHGDESDSKHSGMHRMAEAMAARREQQEKAQSKDVDEQGKYSESNSVVPVWKLAIAGNTKECFRNRFRNIQLVALSAAITKGKLCGITSLDFSYNHLGEMQDTSSTSEDSKASLSDESNSAVEEENAYVLDVAPALARMLQTSASYISTIQELNLSGNRLGPESCKLLCAALQEAPTSLHRLNLSHNLLGVAGGYAIAQWLQSPSCPLTELHMGNTGLEIENLITISSALCRNHTLTSLNLDNPIIRTKEEEAIQHIGKMLQVNDTLCALSLNKHQLTDHGAQVLAERLLDNTTLQRLTLRGNLIGATGAQVLAGLLLRHDALAEFDLSANRIGNVGAKAFAKVLRHNTRPLTMLALCSTYITDEGLVEIAQACLEPRHPGINHLQSLLLWGNDFGDVSAELFLTLYEGRFVYDDIETDFLPTRKANGEEGVQIAHREVQRAPAFASPKR